MFLITMEQLTYVQESLPFAHNQQQIKPFADPESQRELQSSEELSPGVRKTLLKPGITTFNPCDFE